MEKYEEGKMEINRIEELKTYSILETLLEADYDKIVRMVSIICESPISLISIVGEEKVWFKSQEGLTTSSMPREYAFCNLAIKTPQETLVINNAEIDERVINHPAVLENEYYPFYAGIPLVTENGFALGTLCVMDNKPKELTQEQLESLKYLADYVMEMLVLRKNKIELEEKLKGISKDNKKLKKFIEDDVLTLKTPINKLRAISKVLERAYHFDIDDRACMLLDEMSSETGKLKSTIDEFLVQQN